jgi:hypothetical protein
MNTEATLISAVCKNKDISTLLADSVDIKNNSFFRFNSVLWQNNVNTFTHGDVVASFKSK